MRIVQLNLARDQTLADRDAVLDTYHTLTGWSDALAAPVIGRALHDAYNDLLHRRRARS